MLNVSLDGCVPPHHGAINLYEVEHGMLFNSAASSSFWWAQCWRRNSDRRSKWGWWGRLSNQLNKRRSVHCFGVFVNRFQSTLTHVWADLSFSCCSHLLLSFRLLSFLGQLHFINYIILPLLQLWGILLVLGQLFYLLHPPLHVVLLQVLSLSVFLSFCLSVFLIFLILAHTSASLCILVHLIAS